MDDRVLPLIEQIKLKISEDTVAEVYAAEYPPVPLAEIEVAEQILGFRLPELLRVLYIQVANGGFGPYDGIVGLAGGWSTNNGDGETLLELYQTYQLGFPFFPLWQWPLALLPICEDGYGVVCLDCSQPENPMISVQFETPDTKGVGWELRLRQEAPSFQNWLEVWVNKPHPNRK
jgi:hypothetical protein